jgi:hypothetical protein
MHTLPPGRCFLCGEPCAYASEAGTEVCPVCIPAVEQAYAAAGERPTWLLSVEDGLVEIQRDDAALAFDGDVAAAEHVRAIVRARDASRAAAAADED